jgi:hypothetical protein
VPRQMAADGGLAAARHADEGDGGGKVHEI